MKKIYTVLSAAALITSLHAFDGDSKGLVAVETGYGQFEYSYEDEVNTGRNTTTDNVGYLGLKIGAESRDYRLFLDGKYYVATGGVDYINSFGAALQYLIHMNQDFNFFIGLNGGIVNLKIADSQVNKTYEFSEPYYGADVGFNYDLHDNLGIEVGARFMNVEADNTQYYTDSGGASKFRTYKIDNVVNIYASVVFKYYTD